MTDHDQFFKNLLQEFFGDLLRIVTPEIEPKLRVDEPTFLETELFTKFPEGERRYLDLVAQLETLEGEPKFVLVHVEVEREARKTMGRRMLGYAMQLWLEHESPVLPIVIFMKGGRPDVTREEVRIEVFGQRFLNFWYLAFGLEQSQPARYLAQPEPLAWGLAALMKAGKPSGARHRLACLEPVVKADLTDRQRYLLVNCAESYIQLDQAGQREYEALLAEEGNEEVATMEMTWAGRIAHEARQEARESALQEGLEKGREEGKRDLLLEQLERRFGPLSQATVKRVRALTSPEEFSRLAARIVDAQSLQDLGL